MTLCFAAITLAYMMKININYFVYNFINASGIISIRESCQNERKKVLMVFLAFCSLCSSWNSNFVNIGNGTSVRNS